MVVGRVEQLYAFMSFVFCAKKILPFCFIDMLARNVRKWHSLAQWYLITAKISYYQFWNYIQNTTLILDVERQAYVLPVLYCKPSDLDWNKVNFILLARFNQFQTFDSFWPNWSYILFFLWISVLSKHTFCLVLWTFGLADLILSEVDWVKMVCNHKWWNSWAVAKKLHVSSYWNHEVLINASVPIS